MAGIARIDERVCNLDAKVCDMRDTAIKRLDDHAGRVKSLELSRARYKGIAWAGSALAAAAGSVVAYFKS